MRSEKKIELSDFQKTMEKVGLQMREHQKKVQKERSKGNRIIVERMKTITWNKNAKGYCDNVSEGEKREIVKAGDDMCAVGIIRRGRNWGDYSGVFCGECPYFIKK